MPPEVELTHYSGPLPPPEALEHYERIHPGLAGIIIDRAQREMQHRHNLESGKMSAQAGKENRDINTVRFGQVFGFIIALAGLAAAGYTASVGAEWTASIIGGGTLTSLVVAFLKRPASGGPKSGG